MTNKATTKSAGARVPELRIHKQSGRCYGTFNGKVVWFGHRSDAETQARFDTHLAQWLARGRRPEQPRPEGLTVRNIVARYLRHLEEKHDADWQRRNGTRLTLALKPLLAIHGNDMAAEFSPLKLKATRLLAAGGAPAQHRSHAGVPCTGRPCDHHRRAHHRVP